MKINPSLKLAFLFFVLLILIIIYANYLYEDKNKQKPIFIKNENKPNNKEENKITNKIEPFGAGISMRDAGTYFASVSKEEPPYFYYYDEDLPMEPINREKVQRILFV